MIGISRFKTLSIADSFPFQSYDKFLLGGCALHGIAGGAWPLQVVRMVGSALALRDHVIYTEITELERYPRARTITSLPSEKHVLMGPEMR